MGAYYRGVLINMGYLLLRGAYNMGVLIIEGCLLVLIIEGCLLTWGCLLSRGAY